MDSEAFINDTLLLFRDSQDLVSTDPFYEVLKQFLRSGRVTEKAQIDLNHAIGEFNVSSSQVWQQRESSMSLQGVCGDKAKVTHQHVYSVEEFCQTRLEECASCGRLAVASAKSLADGVFDSSVAVVRVDVELMSFLNDFKVISVEASSNRRVYQILGVLFKLLRTCAPEDHFAENIIKWIYTFTLNSILLPKDSEDSQRGRLLSLIHILRVHNVFLAKLIPLVQPPVLSPDSSDEAFEHFQHLYFAMLKSVVSKAEDRMQFINNPKATSFSSPQSPGKSPSDGDNKFVFVSEFDNGGGVSLQPADLEEPSLIQLLAQFEMSRVLSVVFQESHSVTHFEAFAFGKKLIETLFIGLNCYNSPPFRAFIKALMFHVCEVLSYATDYPDSKAYEELFMSTFERFSSDLKFAFSIFWVGLPFDKLSSESRCRIFLKIAGFTTLSDENLLRSVKDFAMSTCRIALHDSAHLLNVCLMVAKASPENDEMKETLTNLTVASVLYVCHLLPSASDLLWKIAKPHFLSFISEQPQVINKLIEVVAAHLSACGSNSKPGGAANAVRSWLELSDFFKSLNYSKFVPDDVTWNTVEHWLLHSDTTSGEYLIAKDVLNNLNWASKAPGLPPFLDQFQHHHRAAIVLLRWVARSTLPAIDRKAAWTIMLRLQLINRNPPRSPQFSVTDTAPFVKTGEPLACFAALVMSPTITSSVEAFVTQGLPLVKLMLDKRYPNEAIHALLLVLADHYTRNAFEYLIASKDFCELIDRILTSTMLDVIKGWAFESSLPKDVLAYGIVGHMRSLNAFMVLEFWLCILSRCSEGFQKSHVMDALELLLSLTPSVSDGLPTLNSILSKHYVDFVESARKHASPVRTFVSWIVGLPFSLMQSSAQSSRWPWFCVASLSHDLQNEFESSFFLRFYENMLSNPTASLDKIFKQAMSSVEEDNKNSSNKQRNILLPTSADNMAIFRLANFAMQQASPTHAATPLAWLLFFRAFLRRPSWTAKGAGYTLLSQQQAATKKQLSASLTQSLKAAIAAVAPLSVASTVAAECKELYSAMLLWLEEPKLHMADFDPRTLPPAFLPDIVLTLIDPSSDPWPSETSQLWLLRYVDLQEVANNVSLFADKFKQLTINASPSSALLPLAAADNSDASGNNDSKPPIAVYLPLPNAMQYSIRSLFPDITPAMCRDFATSLQILMACLDGFRVYSAWVSEQGSTMGVAHEKILETLPNLCTYETVEERITKPCNTFTSYIRPCSSPAVLVARYRKAKRLPAQEAVLNQYAAQAYNAVNALTSMLSPSGSQCPVQIAVASIRLESLISKVVETPGAEDTGRSLYYTVATFIDNNPAIWQTAWDRFLSQCLEMLGQAFIRTCAEQQRPGRGCLLETILNTVKTDYVRRLMSSDFVPDPTSTPALMEILATAISARRISPDFAFTLLSKFEVKVWISELSQPQRSALLASTLRCIVSALVHADFASHYLVELLVRYVDKCLAYNFPDLLHPALELYTSLAETYPACALPPSVWKVLLENVLGSSDYLSCPLLSVDGPLSLQIVDSELNFLSEVFAKARSRLETSQAWREAVIPLSLIASRFYMLAVDRAVLVARVTAAGASSFDMYRMLMTVFGALVSPPASSNPSFMADLRPSFAAFGDSLLHLQHACNEVRFAGIGNIFSRLLATYLELMLEAAAISPTYAKELHTCFGRLQWNQYTPANIGEVEMLEMLCNRDGVFSFWTGTVCSVDWRAVFSSPEFSSNETRTLLVSSLVRMTYTAVLRCPRSSPLGDLVNGCLVEIVRSIDLELLPLAVFTHICSEVRAANGRPLPPQVVFAWATTDDSGSLKSLKDCLLFLEVVSGGFVSDSQTPLTEASLARWCEFIRLIGLLLADCLAAEAQQSQMKQNKQQQQQTSAAVSRVVGAMLQRCDLILSASASSQSSSYIAGRVCSVGLEPLNQSITFANHLLPCYIEYFSAPSSEKNNVVYWLSSVCRSVNAATVAISLAEALLRIYRQFSPSFSWETAQTLVTFVSCQSTAVIKAVQASAPVAAVNTSMAVSYSANQAVQLPSAPGQYPVIPDQSSSSANKNDKKQTALDEFIMLGSVAANASALLVVQALARRAISAAITANNFEIRKATIYTFSDLLVKCCETPKAGDEGALLGLWSLWLSQLVETEQYLALNGINCGAGINSVALDLAFVSRLSTLLSTLNRLSEVRSSRGILGAIGLGSKSPLPQWFHLFCKTSACLLARQYPDCILRTKSGAPTGLNLRQMIEGLSSLRADREYANFTNLIIALVAIVQDTAAPLNVAVERLLGEFRAYNC